MVFFRLWPRITHLVVGLFLLTILALFTMGRYFVEHFGGRKIFSCANCDTFLTNKDQLISMRFTGATGRAFLFKKVVNLEYSEVQDRVMLTGRHMVRDVSCLVCKTKLGWFYEFATEESQAYKEGHVILERALVQESDGFPTERVSDDDPDPLPPAPAPAVLPDPGQGQPGAAAGVIARAMGANLANLEEFLQLQRARHHHAAHHGL